jgi:hypothetical protein
MRVLCHNGGGEQSVCLHGRSKNVMLSQCSGSTLHSANPVVLSSAPETHASLPTPPKKTEVVDLGSPSDSSQSHPPQTTVFASPAYCSYPLQSSSSSSESLSSPSMRSAMALYHASCRFEGAPDGAAFICNADAIAFRSGIHIRRRRCRAAMASVWGVYVCDWTARMQHMSAGTSINSSVDTKGTYR